MTIDNVQDITPRRQYVATAGQTVFAYPFPIFADGDLVVVVNNTTKVLTTDYTVSGSGTNTGGNVTLSVALVGGETVTVYRDMVVARSTNFQQNGPFGSAVFNTELDRLTLMIQEIEEDLQRALRIPITANVLDSDISLDPSTWASKYMSFDANGKPTPALLSASAMTQALIAGLLKPRTQQEITAGIVPANLVYDPGAIPRYASSANMLNGTSDASGAIVSALATGHRVTGVGPEFTYLITSQVLTGSLCDIDLQGATIKVSGNTLGFNSLVSPTTTTTYTGAITTGSRTFTVASATGISNGQWVEFQVSQATEETLAYPPSWAQVTNVAGTTVTVDRSFQMDYPNAPTTATVRFFNDASMYVKCHIRNGTIDGALSTYNSGGIGMAIRANGYKDSLVENVKLTGWSTTLAQDIVVLTGNVKSRMNNVFALGLTCGSQIVNITDCMDGAISGCTIDGSAFGISLTRCDSSAAVNNTLIGRRHQEIDAAVAERSARGIKFYGCKFARCIGNHTTDYETGIRMQGVGHYTIVGNTLVNSAPGDAYSGQVMLGVANIIDGTLTEQGIIANNVVEGCAGVGIAVQSSLSKGKHIVAGNQVKNVQGVAIYVNTPNSTIVNNQIYNWGLRNAGDFAIHHDSGTTCTGNRFYHDTLTTLGCLREVFTTGSKYTFRDNISPTNPLFASSKDVFGFGATTIASGATVQTPNHNLIITPADVTWFKITPGNSPTNDPGHWYVDTLTSTSFKIHVRTDPGAGGAIFGWRAEVPMPFTAP